MNMLSNMDEIANIIIRPNRYLYKPIDLGPKIISIENKSIYHHDFELKNNQKLTIKASLYTEHQDMKDIRSVLLYLHCNSGCRIEGLAYMKMAISHGFSYLIFDFAGSGLSEGNYVSLGTFSLIQVTFSHRILDPWLSISKKKSVPKTKLSFGAGQWVQLLHLNTCLRINNKIILLLRFSIALSNL